MTKKSNARVARDTHEKAMKDQLKDNTCWDDLNDIYNQCTNLLAQHAHIAIFSRNTTLVEKVADKKSLIGLINLLSHDLSVLNDELNSIHKSHADKRGGSHDPDEVMHSITIYEHYNLFMERHQAVVMPTALQITEHFDQAERELVRAGQAERERIAQTEEGREALAEQDEITQQINDAEKATGEDIERRIEANKVVDVEFTEVKETTSL